MTVEEGPINSLLVFREPASAREVEAALHLLEHCDRTEGTRLYVLSDIGWSSGPVPEAAVLVAPAESSWRVVGFSGDTALWARMASELVRAATMAGARQLVAAPDAPRLVRKLLNCSPIAPVLHAGWTVVDL